MDQLVLPVQLRQQKGKGAARSLRRQGLIPGILYGPQREPAMIKVDPKRLRAVLDATGAENVPFRVSLDGGSPVTVMLKELQDEPLTGALLHADLWELTKGKKVHVDVAIHATGVAAGSEKGGILQQVLRELPVECLPEDIPESVEVDVSALDIGDSLHIADIKLPTGLKVLADPEQTVVTCAPPTVVKEEVPPEEVEEEAEEEAEKAEPEAEAAPAEEKES